jgi:anti-anti-sigma factor
VNVQEQQHGGVKVLCPQGPLVGPDAEYLESHFARVLNEPHTAVVLDASAVPFVDSRGLEVLVDVTERLIRAGQALKICGLNDVLREVLDLTEVASLFEQFDDVDAAVGSAA